MKTINYIFLIALISSLILFPFRATAAENQPQLPIVIGGFDPDFKKNLPALLEQMKTAFPLMKSVGATSHEGYVRWGLIEPEQGKFDFSVYDPIVDLYKQYGLKWVPFLIIGSPYSLPDWYFNSSEQQGYVCLEHGKETHVQSLWNPAMHRHIEIVVKAFADHYRDTGVIESVLLGVTGNYGEAIYPATGNDWTNSVHGEYHAHAGYWAGDKYAVASFQSWLEKKYGKTSALNAMWKTSHESFSDIRPFLKTTAPSDRAWYDFITWYRESMDDYTDFWVSTVRKNFPATPVYICTGGDANPQHGSDFGAQSRIAAKYGAGVRITNEGSDYALNFTITRWVASASRFYGGYFGFEPAGTVDKHGIIARIFNVTASGAAHLHTYYGNIFDTVEQKENWEKNISLFTKHTPYIDIALYYSKPSVAFGAEFYTAARELRDYFDYDIMDDDMIEAGSLKNISILVWPSGNRAEQSTLKAIADWIDAGGVLVYYSSDGPIRTVDGDAPVDWPQSLSAVLDEHELAVIKKSSAARDPEKAKRRLVLTAGKGHIIILPGASEEDVMLKRSAAGKFFRWLFSGKLGFTPETGEVLDGEWDHIYFSLVDGGKTIMALSQNKSPKMNKVLIGNKTIEIQTIPDQILFMNVPEASK